MSVNNHTDLWRTPYWLMSHFDNHFDPCPPNPLANGLLREWSTPAFVNPPYSKPNVWVDKSIEQHKKGVEVVMLLRCDPSTRWYKKLIEYGCHISYFNERLRFSESKNSPNFASMLVFLEGRHE